MTQTTEDAARLAHQTPPATQPSPTVGEVVKALLESIARPFPAGCNWEDQARACQAVAQQAIATLHTPPPVAAATVVDAGWQPIETAPKDREILIYCAASNEQFVAVWGQSAEDTSYGYVFVQAGKVSFIVRDPTHWRATPTPPAGGR